MLAGEEWVEEEALFSEAGQVKTSLSAFRPDSHSRVFPRLSFSFLCWAPTNDVSSLSGKTKERCGFLIGCLVVEDVFESRLLKGVCLSPSALAWCSSSSSSSCSSTALATRVYAHPLPPVALAFFLISSLSAGIERLDVHLKVAFRVLSRIADVLQGHPDLLDAREEKLTLAVRQKMSGASRNRHIVIPSGARFFFRILSELPCTPPDLIAFLSSFFRCLARNTKPASHLKVRPLLRCKAPMPVHVAFRIHSCTCIDQRVYIFGYTQNDSPRAHEGGRNALRPGFPAPPWIHIPARMCPYLYVCMYARHCMYVGMSLYVGQCLGFFCVARVQLLCKRECQMWNDPAVRNDRLYLDDQEREDRAIQQAVRLFFSPLFNGFSTLLSLGCPPRRAAALERYLTPASRGSRPDLSLCGTFLVYFSVAYLQSPTMQISEQIFVSLRVSSFRGSAWRKSFCSIYLSLLLVLACFRRSCLQSAALHVCVRRRVSVSLSFLAASSSSFLKLLSAAKFRFLLFLSSIPSLVVLSLPIIPHQVPQCSTPPLSSSRASSSCGESYRTLCSPCSRGRFASPY